MMLAFFFFFFYCEKKNPSEAYPWTVGYSGPRPPTQFSIAALAMSFRSKLAKLKKRTKKSASSSGPMRWQTLSTADGRTDCSITVGRHQYYLHSTLVCRAEAAGSELFARCLSRGRGATLDLTKMVPRSCRSDVFEAALDCLYLSRATEDSWKAAALTASSAAPLLFLGKVLEIEKLDDDASDVLAELCEEGTDAAMVHIVRSTIRLLDLNGAATMCGGSTTLDAALDALRLVRNEAELVLAKSFNQASFDSFVPLPVAFSVRLIVNKANRAYTADDDANQHLVCDLTERILSDRSSAMDSFARFFFGGTVAVASFVESGSSSSSSSPRAKRRKKTYSRKKKKTEAATAFTERRAAAYAAIVTSPATRKRIFSFCAVDIVRRVDLEAICAQAWEVSAHDSMTVLISAVNLGVPELVSRCAEVVATLDPAQNDRLELLPSALVTSIFQDASNAKAKEAVRVAKAHAKEVEQNRVLTARTANEHATNLRIQKSRSLRLVEDIGRLKDQATRMVVKWRGDRSNWSGSNTVIGTYFLSNEMHNDNCVWLKTTEVSIACYYSDEACWLFGSKDMMSRSKGWACSVKRRRPTPVGIKFNTYMKQEDGTHRFEYHQMRSTMEPALTTELVSLGT